MAKVICMDTDVQKTFFSFSKSPVPNSNEIKRWEAATIAEDQDAITARTKYVGAIDGTPMSIGFETGLVYGDATAYELKTDLYLNSQLSAGASYAESSYAGTPDSAWGVNVNYFVTPAIAVGASYVNANAVDSDDDIQTIGLNAKLRF